MLQQTYQPNPYGPNEGQWGASYAVPGPVVNTLAPFLATTKGQIGGLQAFGQYGPNTTQFQKAGKGYQKELQGLGTGISSEFKGNLPFADRALNEGFDPQNALFLQNLGDFNDQMRSGQAARGIAMTPYGASVEAQGQGRFFNDWRDRQLARQKMGAETADILQGRYQSGVEAGGKLINDAGQLNIDMMTQMLQKYGLQGQQLQAAIQAMLGLGNLTVQSERPVSASGGGGRGDVTFPADPRFLPFQRSS